MATDLVLAIPIITGLMMLASIGGAFRALRAKERLRREMESAIQISIESREQMRLLRQALEQDQLDAAQKSVEGFARSLSNTDRKAIRRSLHQASKEGEKRYIADLIRAD